MIRTSCRWRISWCKLRALRERAPLPQVSFVDPDFGLEGTSLENDEHPPTDIQRGQAYVSEVVNALRHGPYWQDSILFITYDEHGGFTITPSHPRRRKAGL